jgi:predicted esterase
MSLYEDKLNLENTNKKEAVLDVNAADGIKEEYPEITEWYIGGHSLGGSMAASYVSKNEEEFKGLILLASYSEADISESALSVLSVYGSEDGVLNMEKYEKYSTKLPHDFEEYVIEGGCHAYFGVYGAQAGDGTPSITNQNQIDITAEKIAEFMG